MSKKIREEMAKYRDKFITGCEKNGIDAKIADKIFAFIEPFAGYGFNKAHACAYAWVAYQTAYLKANYTAEFMAATLTTEAGDAKKVVAAVDECRRMGVEVLPPDVNKSQAGFAVERLAPAGRTGEPRWGVRFGLLAIKNVGSRPIEELMEARASGGPFTSLADVFARTDSKNLTRGAVGMPDQGGGDGRAGPAGGCVAATLAQPPAARAGPRAGAGAAAAQDARDRAEQPLRRHERDDGTTISCRRRRRSIRSSNCWRGRRSCSTSTSRRTRWRTSPPR